MSVNPLRLGELAARIGCQVEGDPDFLVKGVSSLEEAGPSDIGFVRSPQWAAQLAASQVGAVVVPAGVDSGGRPALRSANPALDFARVVNEIIPEVVPEPGIHPSAFVAEDAEVDPSACVGPQSVVSSGVKVGAGTILHSRVTLYPEVQLGTNCRLHSGAVLREGTILGNRVVLQPGVVLGGEGFGYVFDGGQEVYERIPHVGRVVIEDDVEIGANSTVDRAALGETRIRRGAKIDNLVMVAHNCDIGENSVIVAQSGLAGSTVLKRRVIIMAQVGTAGHHTIGEGAFVGARTGVLGDVPDGARVFGVPHVKEKAWHRSVIALRKLPKALSRLRALEKKVNKLDPAAQASRSAETSTTEEEE